MRHLLLRLTAVFAGGAAGTAARWAIAETMSFRGAGFPLATFVANVSGAFLLGYVTVLTLRRIPSSSYVRLLLGVGFLGAYTTFSTMAVEGIRLLAAGQWAVAVTYWVITLLAGQMFGVYGMWLARLPLPRRRERAIRTSMATRPESS